ncbi:MAG: ATP-binding protein [Planctomycetota bacterium]
MSSILTIMRTLENNVPNASLLLEDVTGLDSPAAVAIHRHLYFTCRKLATGVSANSALLSGNNLSVDSRIILLLLKMSEEDHFRSVLELDYANTIKQLIPFASSEKLKSFATSRLVLHEQFNSGNVSAELKQWFKEADETFPTDETRLALRVVDVMAAQDDARLNALTELLDEAKKLEMRESQRYLLSLVLRIQRVNGDAKGAKATYRKLFDVVRSQGSPLNQLRVEKHIAYHGFNDANPEQHLRTLESCMYSKCFLSLDRLEQHRFACEVWLDARKFKDPELVKLAKDYKLDHDEETQRSLRLQQEVALTKIQLKELVEDIKKKQAEANRLAKAIISLRNNEKVLADTVKNLDITVTEKEKLIAFSQQQIEKQENRIEEQVNKIQVQESKIDEQVGRIEQQESKYGSLQFLFNTVVGSAAALLLLITCLCFALVLWNRTSSELIEQERDNDVLNNKLARMRRMDSLGLMAGSIAHDFNNILVGVTGNAELIELARATGNFNEEYAMERIHAIRKSASRAQKLAQQMLNYAGKQYIAQKTVDLNELISDYDSVLRSYSKKRHKIVFDLAKKPIIAKVDETQIEQALLNLVTNAINASTSDGTVWVRTSITELDDNVIQDATLFGSRKTGGAFCCIEIEDHGIGIKANQIDKIFDPYVSDAGQGRGLGLAVVFGIIDSHDGLIRCESTVGQGTKFQMLLPVCEMCESDSFDAYRPDYVIKPESSYVGKRVLVIDDELSVLDTCEQLLAQIGMIPTTVHIRGEDGIKSILVALGAEPFDCIVMDVVMPEMNGTQILDVLEEREISTPVVLMSGFSPHRLDFYQKRPNVATVLPKPFSMSELAAALGRSLEFDVQADVAEELTPKAPKFKSLANRGQKVDPRESS